MFTIKKMFRFLTVISLLVSVAMPFGSALAARPDELRLDGETFLPGADITVAFYDDGQQVFLESPDTYSFRFWMLAPDNTAVGDPVSVTLTLSGDMAYTFTAPQNTGKYFFESMSFPQAPVFFVVPVPSDPSPDPSPELSDSPALPKSCAGFSDVSVDADYCDAVSWAFEAGIVAGYPDGTFKPSRLMNRAELLKVVLESRGVPLPSHDGKDALGFTDVGVDQWYMPYIQQGKALKIFEGDSGGKKTARPGEPVNRVEALKLAFATIVAVDAYRLTSCSIQPYVDSSFSDWFFDYACRAKEFGLFDLDDPSYLLPGKKATRAEVVLMLYRMNRAGLFLG